MNFKDKLESQIGEVCYSSYAHARRWKAFDGTQLPEWAALDEDMQKAWTQAGLASVAIGLIEVLMNKEKK